MEAQPAYSNKAREFLSRLPKLFIHGGWRVSDDIRGRHLPTMVDG